MNVVEMHPFLWATKHGQVFLDHLGQGKFLACLPGANKTESIHVQSL